jgi:hypothetical protein
MQQKTVDGIESARPNGKMSPGNVLLQHGAELDRRNLSGKPGQQ